MRLRTSHIHRSLPQFFLPVPPSPMALYVWNAHMGFLALRSIDFYGSEAVGQVSFVSTVDFSRPDTMYISVFAWEGNNRLMPFPSTHSSFTLQTPGSEESVILGISIQAFKHPINIITSVLLACVTPCVSVVCIWEENGKKWRAINREEWMDKWRAPRSIITGKKPLPSSFFLNLAGRPNSRTEKKVVEGFCFVLIFIFSASQQLHSSLGDTWGGGVGGGGGGEHKQKEGYSALECYPE